MSTVASIDDQRQSPPKDTTPDEAKPTGNPDITASRYQQDIAKRRPANKTGVLQQCLSVLQCSLKCLHMRTCATGTRNLLQQSQKLFGARLLMSSGDFTIRIVYPKLFTGIDVFTEEIRFDSRGYHFTSKHASYSVVIVDGFPKVTCVDVKSLEIFSPQWFHECLQARLCHWASLSLDHSPPSLNLVNYENYQKVYVRLKTCYWEDLRASWCEKTDPEKFIHEDFGIAAYLICIWSSLKKEDVYFVDIGCGNGLLVYLLISEGFHGIGVDIKRRGMWRQYPAKIAAALREETLDPSTHPGFPQATLLIGNHSDELTPWLPVLATRSNSQCQVFTVPCCPFSLYQKFDAGQYAQQLRDRVYQQLTDYRRRNLPTFTTESTDEPNLLAEGGFWRGRYRHYIHYLEDVFRICGFEPELDILRIPSTKRICLLGRQHIQYLTYSQRLEGVNKLLELESHPCRSCGYDDPSNTATN
nr:unnamed protein product [Spirometra erinaceieuropaei]